MFGFVRGCQFAEYIDDQGLQGGPSFHLITPRRLPARCLFGQHSQTARVDLSRLPQCII